MRPDVRRFHPNLLGYRQILATRSLATMGDAMVEHHIGGIVRRCHVGIDAVSLRLEVLRRLRSVMTIDAAFFATVDPATMLFTSAVSEEPLIAAAPLFLDNELARTDVNRFSDLAVAVDPVASLDSATRGDRPASTRYSEIMAPMGLGDELRVALRTGDRCWGVMCLHREDSEQGFSGRDAAIVRRLAPHLAEGLRRSVLLQASVTAAPVPGGPGILVLDDKLSVVSARGRRMVAGGHHRDRLARSRRASSHRVRRGRPAGPPGRRFSAGL